MDIDGQAREESPTITREEPHFDFAVEGWKGSCSKFLIIALLYWSIGTTINFVIHCIFLTWDWLND